MPVSKTVNEGSNPSTPVIKKTSAVFSGGFFARADAEEICHCIGASARELLDCMLLLQSAGGYQMGRQSHI